MADENGRDEMLTLKETREILKVSRNTMYMLVRDGLIPARKVGSEWRISRFVLEAWMREREN
jgi:excisionase family DNA binding protein